MKLNPYPEYKDSGVEWVGKIPKDWGIKRLKHFTENLDGKRIPISAEQRISGSIPYYGAAGVVDHVDDFIFDEKLLLIGEDGAPFFDPYKDVSFIIEGKSWVNNHAHVLRVLERMNIKILMHQLNQTDYAFFIKGSTRDKLNQDQLKEIPIIEPPEDIQTGILSYLDKKTSEIDLTIEKDTHLIELLKEKRTALINHVVTKGLDPTVKMKDSGVEWISELPEECEITRLKFFTSLLGGYAFKSNDFSDSGIQLIRIGNLYKNKLALERKPVYLPKNYSEIYPQFILRKGDIIISMTGTVNKEDYGYTVQINSEKPFLMNQRVGKFIVDKTKINKKYFKYVLESRIFLDSLYSIPSGTKQANLSPENILNIKIYVFEISKQQEIVEYLDKKTLQIDKTIQKIQENISLLEEYKKSLIYHVVTGKVDVREVAV